MDGPTIVTLKTAVRDMVYFTRRRGDLGSGSFGGVSAMEGMLGHQRLQRARPSGYQAEVRVAYTRVFGEFALEIGGRIDGVFSEAIPPIVEEIKTTTRPFEDIEESVRAVHLAQARIYAYLYGLDRDITALQVQLTYFNIDTGETHTIRESPAWSELAAFFEAVTGDYLKWAKMLYLWQRTRDESIVNLQFPHNTYRQGQRAFAVAVYQAIRDRRHLFAQAPTGIGKTLGALFPAIKAFTLPDVEKIFFLTAKTLGARVAESALKTMADAGLRIKSLTITARDKACFANGGPCDPRACDYARGYYDRLADALEEAFTRDALTREALAEVGRRYRVCPYALSHDMAHWTDLVIGDYNYAFDPGAHLRRFFGESGSGNLLLVDEAHNLVDRARAMYSAELDRASLLFVRRGVRLSAATAGEATAGAASVAKCLDALNRKFLALRKALGEERQQVANDVPAGLIHLLHVFCAAVEKMFAQAGATVPDQNLASFYFQVRRFLRTAEGFDVSSAVIIESQGKNLVVKLFNIDPASQLGVYLARSQAAVFFSGTLSPPEYFSRLLLAGERHRRLRLPSPFPADNLCLLVAHRIETRYRGRAAAYDQVVAMIAAVVNARSGNYLVFFPSYRYLDEVYNRFERQFPHIRVGAQSPAMDDAAREAFLAQFEETAHATLVGFAVMGGAFGEGIDLVGDRLIGVIVVGAGLPQVNTERALIKSFFGAGGADWDDRGFAFAYRYPGMCRVLQTMGRLIRSERDRGVACLIDPRFATAPYRELFPPEWRPLYLDRPEQAAPILDRFWKAGPQADAESPKVPGD